MADNTTLNPGAAGDVIRTLDRTGTGSPKTEVVQLDIGGGDGFGEKLVQGQVPVSLLDTEWPVDDDGVPLVNLSTGNAADPPTGTQLQQILSALLLNPAQVNPPPQLGRLTVGGLAGQNTFKTNGCSAAVIIFGPGSTAFLGHQTFGSIDGQTFFAIPFVYLDGNMTAIPGTVFGVNGLGLNTTSPSTFRFGVNCAGLNYIGVRVNSVSSGSAELVFQPLTNIPAPIFIPTTLSDASTGTPLTINAIGSQGSASTNTAQINFSAIVTAATGVQKVGISGNAAATLDAVIANGTAPTNMLAVGGQFNSTRLTLANLQSSALQLDSDGSLLVNLIDAIFQGAIAAAPPANAIQIGLKAASANPANATAGNQVAPFGDQAGRLVVCSVNPRSLMKSTATTISATGATTIVAAQGAGVFADITQLIITTAGLAAQTITISDGTLSWIIDYPNAAVAPGQPLVISFSEVPLAATTANTAWTANQSVATACHYLVQFANKLA